MLEASKKENISLNGVEIEDTFAEIFTLMEISPAQSPFLSLQMSDYCIPNLDFKY